MFSASACTNCPRSLKHPEHNPIRSLLTDDQRYNLQMQLCGDCEIEPGLDVD